MEYWKQELYHHGIKGQQWGQRNGPPYPLSSSNVRRRPIKTSSLTKIHSSEKLNTIKRKDVGLDKIVKVSVSKNKIKLPTKTYAKVMSSISSNMTKHQRYNETYFTKAVGNYRYLVKNHFDGTIELVGRTKIPDSTTKMFERNFNK